MDKAFVSFRIGTPLWIREGDFTNLLGVFAEYPGLTDDISLFTSATHPPLPLDVNRERAAIAGQRIAQARARGYKIGINHLATIGHISENIPQSLAGDFTHITDINGAVCLGALCPNDERVQSYIRECYAAFAAADPDYIWIDDDVRLWGHTPIAAGCFCDKCISIFEEESGGKHTRDSLRAAFSDGPLDDKLRVRKAWIDHNRETMASLFELIEKAVHGVKPHMPLGFMTGDRFFEGYDFARWAKILAGPNDTEVLWRPGGGFYDDDLLKGMAEKSHSIGRQVSALPDSVVSIQSEIENFPYQCLKKSANATALEAASHIAAGCTGTAFNVLTMPPYAPVDECRPILARAAEMRPFYDLLASTLGRSKPLGVYTGWNKDSFIANNAGGDDWFAGDIWSIVGEPAKEVLEIGIPAAYALEAARVTLLSGDSVLAMSEQEITKILSSGVYMDSGALSRLNEMGYGDLTGFASDGCITEDGIEEMTDHPLNSNYAASQRDARQSFLSWMQPAARLVTTRDGTQNLARLVDYSDTTTAQCCMGIFENRLGGRVCVAGYYPWTFLQSSPKSSQIKSTMRWLSRDTLPGYVESFHKMNLWVREVDGDRTAAVVLNASLDPAREAVFTLRTKKDLLSLYDMECVETIVSAVDSDGPYKRFVLPTIGAWEMRMLVA